MARRLELFSHVKLAAGASAAAEDVSNAGGWVSIYSKGAAARFTLDGTTPTATNGFFIGSGERLNFSFSGTEIKAIRDASTDAVLEITSYWSPW